MENVSIVTLQFALFVLTSTQFTQLIRILTFQEMAEHIDPKLQEKHTEEHRKFDDQSKPSDAAKEENLKLQEQLRKLQTKYNAMGQDLSSYLDGLLYSDYLTYWDYIHLDTLLSLQTPKA
jgi:hypothetical protein